MTTPPPLTLAARRCKELLRKYAREIGPENLTPHRKQPLTRHLILAMLRIESGAPILEGGKPWRWDTPYGISTRAAFEMLAQTGQRKAEVALAAGVNFDKMHLSFANITYLVGGEKFATPSIQLLRLWMSFGFPKSVFVVFQPGPSKCDQFGLRWSNSLIYLPLDMKAGINAARAIILWEIAAQVEPHKRRETPLFCGPAGPGSALTQDQLDRTFKRLLRWVLADEEEVRKYSIHSFRCYLASALLASGRSDPEIQVALRWASPEALQIYKVHNVEEYAGWLIEAEKQDITGMRALGLPRKLPRPPPQHDHLDRAMALLDADADLQAQATAADAAQANGTSFETTDAVADYDLDSW